MPPSQPKADCKLAIPLTAELGARFARFALDCVHRAYPSHVVHLLLSDDDAQPPRRLTPAFYGSFDWHSAVHGHWCLARLARLFPQADWATEARAALDRSLTAENLDAEVRYVGHPARAGFERPYGLAWLLQLAAELREWDDADARRWSRLLEPLEQLAVRRFREWLPRLTHPIRSGEHSQTAFAMGLCLDYCRTTGDDNFRDLLLERSRAFHLHDRSAPIHYEPSGHDFLSPALAEADLMRRVLPVEAFAAWLTDFLPGIPRDSSAVWLQPVTSPDPSDGKLAHLDGLSLSRAWMLEGIASALPEGDPRSSSLAATADIHRDAGLAAISGEHYAGAHWLASFAVYLTTERGIGP